MGGLDRQAHEGVFLMRRGQASLILLLALTCAPLAFAGNFPGEQPVYAREVGQEQLFFYGTSGGANGQIEYICRAFSGTTGSDDPTTSVWQVEKLSYNSDGQITSIELAGDDEAYNQVCANRASLNYD